MKEFLNRAMKKHRSGETEKVARFVDLFPKTTKVIVDSLGEKPFNVRGPLNGSVLDSVFCTVMDNLDDLVPDLRNNFELLKQNNEFEAQTTKGTTDTNTLRNRFELVRDFLVQK
ncbi:MAG: hypothetical protein ACFB0E_02455 [Leptolyngbyaceae cyanobacterium]